MSETQEKGEKKTNSEFVGSREEKVVDIEEATLEEQEVAKKEILAMRLGGTEEQEKRIEEVGVAEKEEEVKKEEEKKDVSEEKVEEKKKEVYVANRKVIKDEDEDKAEIEALFKRYDVTKEQITVFNKVKEKVDYLCNVRILLCVVCKKTIPKSLKACENFAELIKTFKVDEVDYGDEHFIKYLLTGAFFSYENAPDVDGYNYIYWDYSKWEHVKNDKELYKVMGFILRLLEDFLFVNKKNFKDGIVMVVDGKTCTLGNIDWKLETVGGKFFGKFPVRLKKMVCFNFPWYWNLLYILFSPFISKKMRSRLNLCKEKELPKFFPLASLPKVHGGTLDVNIKKWVKETFQLKVAGKKTFEKRKKKKFSLKELKEKTKDMMDLMKDYKKDGILDEFEDMVGDDNEVKKDDQQKKELTKKEGDQQKKESTKKEQE